MPDRLVAFLPSLPDEVIELTRQLAPPGFEVEVADLTQDREGALSLIGRADYLLGFPYHLDEQAFAAAARHVRLIQLLSAGSDEIDVAAASRHGLPVATNGGANSVAVAEHTLMLTLAVLKQLPELSAAVLAGRWPVPNTYSTGLAELRGRRVGLVGLGQIGRRVAGLVQAFGATVAYFDVQRLAPEMEETLGVTFSELAPLLAQSDVVSLHLPLTPATANLLDAERLAHVKQDAVLVNTARGQLIDEDALLGLLDSGRLRGAALDTLAFEPGSPSTSPLVGHPRVLVTPHSAGSTWDSWFARLEHGWANVRAVESGEEPRWLVRV